MESAASERLTNVYHKDSNELRRGPNLPMGMKLHCFEFIDDEKMFLSDGNNTFQFEKTWTKVKTYSVHKFI